MSSSSNNNTLSSSWIKNYLVIVLLGPIIFGIVVQKLLFSGDAPPPTFGSGSMFDTIANRYDVINRIIALGMDIGWRQKQVNIIKDSVVNVKSPQLLDIATGTADVAIQLAHYIPNAHITGIDPSNNMLSIGKSKVISNQLSTNITLEIADAQQLSKHYKHNYYHGATMSFGIRNIPDRQLALCEIHTILKKNATFCILELSEPTYETGGILGAYGASYFIRYVVPLLGGIVSGKPRAYWHLQQSIADFPSPTEFGKQLENLHCGKNKKQIRHFKVHNIQHLNFGSIQLYHLTKQ